MEFRSPPEEAQIHTPPFEDQRQGEVHEKVSGAF